jgi:hypothetical protein
MEQEFQTLAPHNHHSQPARHHNSTKEVSMSQHLCRLFCLAVLFIIWSPSIEAQHRSGNNRGLRGQRAIVIDERWSALRARPEINAPLVQRLRRGRVVGVIKPGPQYHLVQLTRRTRGWILAEALARSGRADDAARWLRLIEATTDDFTRARLARLCADEFRHTPAASRALLLLGETAEAVSDRLTREARKRAGDEHAESATHSTLSRRDYLLSHAGLDRWNRAGITFAYEAEGDRLIYDGAAWRELARKYPGSDEAKRAREKTGRAKSAVKN